MGSIVQEHPYHLVDPSPWPLTASLAALGLTSGLVMWFHAYVGGGELFVCGFLAVLFTMYVWWRDIIREATFEGQHTLWVQKGMRMGMMLFIVSEVMFFFGFFWAFFHAALVPVQEIGCVWPPQGLEVLSAWEVPSLNTLILLTSGSTCTWTHHGLVGADRRESIKALLTTLFLAAIFTLFQGFEYKHATFTIADSVYGSSFFLTTGFHGLHVQIGTIFLAICLIRIVHHHFTREHHFGFEAGAWYWHFVDIVWLGLFAAVYWWGGL